MWRIVPHLRHDEARNAGSVDRSWHALRNSICRKVVPGIVEQGGILRPRQYVCGVSRRPRAIKASGTTPR